MSTNSSTTGSGGSSTGFDPFSSIDEGAFGYPKQVVLEFGIFMIPTIYFLLVCIKRLITLSGSEDTYLGSIIQISYRIKRRTCMIISLIYVVQIVLAQVLQPEQYWISGYRILSLLYFFNIIAWYLGARLLDKEVERGLYQRWSSHKFYWVISFLMTCFKLSFAYEEQVAALIFNIIKLIFELYLTLYAFAKPFDSEDAEASYDSPNRVPLIRNMLEGIEEMDCSQNFFGSYTYTKGEPLMRFRRPSEQEEHEQIYKGFMKKKGVKNFTYNEPENWLKYLPILTCKVHSTINDKSHESDVNVLYTVETYAEGDVYKKIHQFSNFLKLEQYIKERFDPSKAPWMDRDPPSLAKTDMDDYDDHQQFFRERESALSNFLTTLGGDPRFMVDRVLEFLGVEEPHKSAYINYNDYLSYKNTSKKQKTQQNNNNNIDIELKELRSPPKLKKEPSSQVPNDNLPYFTCFCSEYRKARYGDHYEYVFVIDDQHDSNSDEWTIIKSFKDFKNFNENLEKTIGKSIPQFQQYVPKPQNQRQTMEPAFIEKRKEGLEKYLKSILKNRINYKEILYEFLEYDSALKNHSSKSTTPRQSFFGHHPSSLNH